MDTATTCANIGQWGDLFARDIDHQYVSGELVGRATGLIGEIGRQARARGFSVEAPSAGLFAKARRGRWAWPHLIAGTQDGHLLSFHVAERSKTGTGPKTRTLADRRPSDGEPTWRARRSTTFAPTGVLTVRVDSDAAHYRLRTSSDSANTAVETRLPNLFDAVIGELVRCDEVRRRVREHRDRETATRRRCRTERLYSALCDEVAEHERMRAQREYLDQVERGLDGEGPEEVRRAIASMREHIDARDPLTGGGIGWATQPEPTEEELFEYARRTIPSGCHRSAPSVPPRGAPEHPASGPGSRATGRSGFFD